MAEPHSHKNPWIRTPLVHSIALSRLAGCQIYLKLELHQPSGSFKSRGIGNFLVQSLRQASSAIPNSSTPPRPTHFYTSSGGNAGLACVHAALTLDCAATVVVPMTCSAFMINKLRTAGAKEVIQIGASWAECDAHLREVVIPAAEAKGEKAVYVHPFDGQATWDGHATLVDELVEDMNVDLSSGSSEGGGPKAVVCSVGGGGLFCGIVQGLKKHGINGTTKVVALETEGADSLYQAVHTGTHIELPAITSIATSLGARKVAAQAYEYAYAGARDGSVICARLSDADAIMGCLELAEWERILVEPACGVNAAVCMNGTLRKLLPELKQQDKIVIVVCGGSNINVDMLADWKKQYIEARTLAEQGDAVQVGT